MKTVRWRSSMKRAPFSSLLALALTVLAPGLSYGGEIDIQSELGRGACFKLVFPPLRVRRKLAVAHDSPVVAVQ